MATVIDVRNLDWYEQLGKAMEEDRRRERKEKKKARWQARDNKEFNNQYVRHGRIDPIIGTRGKNPVRFSQLSDKEKQEFIAQMKARQEQAIKQHAKERTIER